ncbi:MAG TPA: hypothetical protein VKA08_18145, partial [Balneolales bacterium]|nr:hypothetical protein [Balneolales bacterium]
MNAEVRGNIQHTGILILVLSAAFVILAVLNPYNSAQIIFALGISAALVVVLAYNPTLYIYLYLLSLSLYLNNSPGIQTTDLIFFILTILFVVFFTIPYSVTNKTSIDNTLDYWYLLFIICLIFGFFNGLVHSTNKALVVSDLAYFLGLSLYFPLKNKFREKRFQRYAAIIFSLILIFVLVRNFIDYKQIILSSVETWQVQDARVPMNELLVMSGAIFALVTFASIDQFSVRIISFILYGLFVAGLILTQSRGYWIAFIVSVITLLVIGKAGIKKKILYLNLFLGIAVILIAVIFFNNLSSIVIKALIHRWDTISTLSSESKLGSSLLERVYETQQISSKIL